MFFDCDPYIASHLPGPDVDDHVMLVTHTDNVFAVGGESDARHAVLMFLQLGHLRPLRHIPDPHRRHMTTLNTEKEQREMKHGETFKNR